MSEENNGSGNPGGRPKKADGPRVPYEVLDQLLVFGELQDCGEGASTVVFPSYRALARRFGVSHSLIAQYSKRHDCLNRRANNRSRVKARTEQRLVELRSEALAVSQEHTLKIIDEFLVAFEEALNDGRIRCDNPSDFNLMVRLKSFLQGGADSRKEIRGDLSLESLQERHRQMLNQLTRERHPQAEISPDLDDEAGAEEVSGQFRVDGVVDREMTVQ